MLWKDVSDEPWESWRRRCRLRVQPNTVCQNDLETPEHALLSCNTSNVIVVLRVDFLHKVYISAPSLRMYRGTETVLLQKILAKRNLTDLLAKFTHQVLAVFETAPMHVPLNE